MASSSIEAAGPAFLRATRQARAAQAEAERRGGVRRRACATRKAYLQTRRFGGRVKRRLDGGELTMSGGYRTLPNLEELQRLRRLVAA